MFVNCALLFQEDFVIFALVAYIGIGVMIKRNEEGLFFFICMS